MRTFMVRGAYANESEAKPYEAMTAGDAAEWFASDAFSARPNLDCYELIVTRDDGKVYEVTVEVDVSFDAFINGSPAHDSDEMEH